MSLFFVEEQAKTTSLAQYVNRAVSFSVIQTDSQEISQVFYTFIFGIVSNHTFPVFWLGKQSYSLNIYVLQTEFHWQ